MDDATFIILIVLVIFILYLMVDFLIKVKHLRMNGLMQFDSVGKIVYL